MGGYTRPTDAAASYCLEPARSAPRSVAQRRVHACLCQVAQAEGSRGGMTPAAADVAGLIAAVVGCAVGMYECDFFLGIGMCRTVPTPPCSQRHDFQLLNSARLVFTSLLKFCPLVSELLTFSYIPRSSPLPAAPPGVEGVAGCLAE